VEKTCMNIPFGGFYESLWSDLIDREVESFAENRTEEQDSVYYPESNMPEPLHVDFGFAWEHMNYAAAYLDVAKDYVEAFAEWLEDAARDIDPDAPACGLTFARLDSPREYNFRTDDIDCDVNESFVAWMFAQTEKDGFRALTRTLERRHKSYDGFHSFYSHRLADWLAKPVAEWDYHELRSLLESVFESALAEDWRMDLYYALSDGAYAYFDANFDYAAFDAKVLELRAEKLAEWLDSDPEAAGRWIAHNAEKAAPMVALLPSDCVLPDMPYRCAKTPDMFAGT